MTRANQRTLLALLGFVLFILALTTLFIYISPEEIVQYLGVQNGYILVFLVSLFGGFSGAGSLTFISLVITLAVGGINPVNLGIVSGIGLAIGDTVMFYAGSVGRNLIKGEWNEKISRLTAYVNKRNSLKKFIPFGAYLYMSLAPLPNDVLLLFLAGIRYPLKKMVWVIILGDITFALLLALVAANI